MEKIQRTMQRLTQETQNHNSSKGLAISDNRRLATLQKAASSFEFITLCNPEYLTQQYGHLSIVSASDSSCLTIWEISQIYKLETAEIFIQAHLIILNDWVNFNNEKKLSDFQVKEISRLFIKKYSKLNIAELSLFFDKLKMSDYGKLYGSLSADFIMNAIKEYIEHRNKLLARRGGYG